MRKLTYVATNANLETTSFGIMENAKAQGVKFRVELREVHEEKSEKMLNWEKAHREKIEKIRHTA